MIQCADLAPPCSEFQCAVAHPSANLRWPQPLSPENRQRSGRVRGSPRLRACASAAVTGGLEGADVVSDQKDLVIVRCPYSRKLDRRGR
eukprot:3080999-Pleurochrysis_carterae.AAC.1